VYIQLIQGSVSKAGRMSEDLSTMKSSYGIDFIKECQRNRFPLLFLDRITQLSPGTSADGLKCFTYNEWFFPAHFEDNPVVPGFVLLESMTQTFIMTFLSLSEYRGQETAFLTIREARFSRKVIPGDVLSTHAELERFRFGIAEGRVTGHVGEDIACEVKLSVGIPSKLLGLQPKRRTPEGNTP